VWLAAERRASSASGVLAQRLAEALERWHEVGLALRDGTVNPAQASVIVGALDELPSELDPQVTAKACAQLLADAGHFGPRELRVLGRRVLEAVAPDVADHHEERLLHAEGERGRRETRLSFRPRGDGVTDVIARVPDHVADRLRVYLDAFTAPRRHHLASSGSEVDLLPLTRRGGQAFCALLEHLPTDGLPTHGGTATSVVVMLDWESLRRGAGSAALSTGGRMSVSEVRRLACSASLLPAVLGGRGEVLDLGRSRRLFSPGPAQGHGPSRPQLPRRGLRNPRRLVRGPPRRLTLVGRRSYRPRRWRAALLVPPPPRPRPSLGRATSSDRTDPLSKADVRGTVTVTRTDGEVEVGRVGQ
jgi:hypothetical protein